MEILFKEIKLYSAEFFGTFFLVLIGCGSIVVNEFYNNVIGHVGISLAFGTIVMVMIYSVGNISGAHLNPAVSFGFLLAGRIKLKTLFFYFISQFSGALFASAIIYLAFPGLEDYGTTLPGTGLLKVFIAELCFTFLLMFVILNVSTGHKEKGIMAGVAIGSTVFLLALVGGPISGASMNPARSLAPALFSLKFNNLWLYLSVPFAGSALSVPVCKLIQKYEVE